MLAIGIMSGTSLDGVDACLVDIKKSKKNKFSIVHFSYVPYDKELKTRLLNISSNKSINIQLVCSINVELGKAYVKAVKKLLKDAKVNAKDIEFIAMHGQTVWHNPDMKDNFESSTLQLGDPSVLAAAFGCKVISNFRTMDMACGGSGAPLVPFANYVLYSSKKENIALQNIGGISNVTYLKKNGTLKDVVAFDTGPGNMMIDEATLILFNKPFDESGNIAKSGTINKEVLDELLNDEYIKKPYPKSTGREKYNTEFVNNVINKILSSGGKKEDVISTLTAFTAYSIIYAYDNFLDDIDQVIISGGGSHNEYMMNILKEKYHEKVIIENRTDAFEAFGFAILGHMTLLNKPSKIKFSLNRLTNESTRLYLLFLIFIESVFSSSLLGLSFIDEKN
jgi:anhydro-N-acetylmuramic acid kinase